jgi:hypothetical protein
MKLTPHELPVLYLKGFCIPEASKVWLYRLGLPFNPGLKPHRHNPVLRGLRQVALRKDRYAVRTKDGLLHYRYEEELQRQENRADSVLSQVRDLERIDTDGKLTLTKYITLTLRRTANRDKALLGTIPPPGPFSPGALLASQLARDGRFSEARDVLDVEEWVSTADGRTELLRESMLQALPRVESVLMSRTWQFLVAPPSQRFFTSDRPVVSDARGLLFPPLLFPLSQRVILEVGAPHKDELSYREVSADEFERLRTMVLVRAHTEIYSPEVSPWIHETWASIPELHRSA